MKIFDIEKRLTILLKFMSMNNNDWDRDVLVLLQLFFLNYFSSPQLLNLLEFFS